MFRNTMSKLPKDGMRRGGNGNVNKYSKPKKGQVQILFRYFDLHNKSFFKTKKHLL